LKFDIRRFYGPLVIKSIKRSAINVDGFVKSPRSVMLDLIRHPDAIEFTGVRRSPE
jgi:hypothetical protein